MRETFESRLFESASEAETEAIGEKIARRLGADDVVLLEGELGSGKTVLVRGLARAARIDPRLVQSPTYTLIHEYEGEEGRLVHVDLYRLEPEEIAAGQLEALGLDELLAGPGRKAVEWAERLPDPPARAWRIRIRRLGEDDRREIVLRRDPSATPEH